LSKTHGDTSRFHRLRKAKFARRAATEELRVKIAAAAAAKEVKK